MKKMFPKLFQRGNIGCLEVDNRIIKAPAHVCLGAVDGTVTERLIRFFEEQARGGAGLIITGLARVSSHEMPKPHSILGIDNDDCIPGLSSLAQGILNNGAKPGIQLAHLGSHAYPAARCVSLEGVKFDIWYPIDHPYARGLKVYPHQEYSINEIHELISSYGDASIRAKTAGFKLIEVHAAHGHGLSQFLSPLINKRTDSYGGNAENRRRILLEIIEDIRKKAGNDFPISVRLNCHEDSSEGLKIEEVRETAIELEKVGVDILHISGDGAASPAIVPPGIFIKDTESVKRLVKIPVVASGCITSPELAEEIISTGKADFISVVRSLFADPFWPRKAKEDRSEEIRPCIRCNDGCLERSTRQAIQCSVNVTLGRELSWPINRSEQPKKVAIIGGGPAGMEAARVCSLLGHRVTLYEKRKLGGALNEASTLDYKANIKRLIFYYVKQMEKLGVNIIYQEATADTIKMGNFDVAIVAAGASYRIPNVPGIDTPKVFYALDILNGKVLTGQKIHVVGGGMIGVEAGLFLAEQGKEIIFTTRQEMFMSNYTPTEIIFLKNRFSKQKVTIYTSRQLHSITDMGSILIDSNGNLQVINADSIVIASGYDSQRTLLDQLEDEDKIEIYAIGDCVSPRKIFDAIHEGHEVARKI